MKKKAYISKGNYSHFQIGGYFSVQQYIITERKGNRNITVCRVGLKDIVTVREVNSANKSQVNAERKNMARYTYDTSFIAPRRIELICKIGEDDLSVLVTYDEQLLTALNKNK